MGLIPKLKLFSTKSEFEEPKEQKKEVVKLPFNIEFSKTPMTKESKKDKMYTLTNVGRQQLESLEGSEMEFPYLSTMTQKRAWSVEDLSNALKFTDARVLFDMRTLERKGFVKVLGAGGE